MKRGNFRILENYSHFVPGAPELVILFVWFIVGVLAGNAVSLVFSFFLPAGKALEAAMPVAYVCMFIPPMLYASFKSRAAAVSRDGLKLDSSNLSPLGWTRCIPIVVFATLALGIVAEAAGSVLPPMPEMLEKLLESMTTGNFWINFLCVSVFAPFFEEWLCRGMVLRGLLGHGVKPWLAIAVSALIFALIHANPWQAIPAFMLGCLFGYVYYRTGSLKLTMLMHFTNNTFALICGHIDSIKDMATWKELLGSSYGIVLAASVILVALSVLAFRRIPLINGKGNIDEVKPLW